VAPHTYKKLPYDPLKDFRADCAVHHQLPRHRRQRRRSLQDPAEMVAYAKANPGKLTVATNGEGGFPHLAMEDLRILGGFYLHRAVQGLAQIVGDLIAARCKPAIDGITGLTTQIRAGKYRLLAVTNPTRATLWPDTPPPEAVPAMPRAAGSATSPRAARRARWWPNSTTPSTAREISGDCRKLVAQGLMSHRAAGVFRQRDSAPTTPVRQVVKAIGFQPR